MPGLAKREDTQLSHGGFWSSHRHHVSHNELLKFWSDQKTEDQQKLLQIDKKTLLEQARKHMYCTKCYGLLHEEFLEIEKDGKPLKWGEAGAGRPSCNKSRISEIQKGDGTMGTCITNGCRDEMPDPSVHPWGGLTSTREGSLTLMDCYLYSKSLKGLQNVFDSARARERERELLYPDACGGGGRGWISHGIRGHGTRETCALHTAWLSCDTLVDFWSALGEETRLSLLRMKEQDFIDRLNDRFDSKRFCRDCRRNVIREFKELKELKRLRKEPRCTYWFCVADTAFQSEVSNDTVQANWRHILADTVGPYHHFEWAVGTGEGKSDILEFENVGMNVSVKVSGLDLTGLSACFITLRAWKLDGRCIELSVKAHALKGQQCVHCRLIVGDGYVRITRGETIRSFFERAEEAEEEEDDDSMDKDGNDLDGECSRPQRHAKSPELAREFLLDAATVIFKEQVEKAFRDGTARQNSDSVFVCLALKLLEEQVHVACKDKNTLEKQVELLEEEEKEKREEQERKERKRAKDREKKLRRKERMKAKEKDRGQKDPEEYEMLVNPVSPKEVLSLIVDEDPGSSVSCVDSVKETGDSVLSRPGSPDIPDVQFQNGYIISKFEDPCFESPNGEITNGKGDKDSFTIEQSKFSRRRLKFTREVHQDASIIWSDRRRCATDSVVDPMVDRSELRCSGESFRTPARGANGSKQQRINSPKLNGRHFDHKFTEKFPCSSNRMSDRYDFSSRSCNKSTEYKAKVDPDVPITKAYWETKSASKSEYTSDISKQFYNGNKFNQDVHERSFRPKIMINYGVNPSRDFSHPKKIWEPIDVQKKYPRSSSDSDVTLSSSAIKTEERTSKIIKSSDDLYKGEVCAVLGVIYDSSCNLMEGSYENGISGHIVNSTSNSDNCSSCLSEGDSNTTSSDHGNQDSSSTSDSEDASQQSREKETSVCIPNGSAECNEVIENILHMKKGELTESKTLRGLPSNGGTNPLTTALHGFDNGLSAACVGSQQQSMLPPMQNQNVKFPMFQAPSTMGYYHQSPVSWLPAPTDGLLPFTHPNRYLYASPLGYGIDANSGFCMQYNHMQQLPTPLFAASSVPLYQPLINTEEQAQISKSSAQESPVEAATHNSEAIGHFSMQISSIGEDAHNDNSAKLHMKNSGFSLFHYGGPVALSSGGSFDSIPFQEENARDLPLKCSDHSENNPASNKDSTMEEYNLFAANNGMRFPFF